MILAAMQPYCFPYLGYYQLAAGADHFVFLDDAAFIRRGHIHRNTLLQNGRPWHYTLSVAAASQNRPINQHHFAGGFARFLLQLRHAYARAPFRDDVIALVAATCRPEDGNVAEVCEASVRNVFDYLGLPFAASRASSLDVEGVVPNASWHCAATSAPAPTTTPPVDARFTPLRNSPRRESHCGSCSRSFQPIANSERKSSCPACP